jgi:hypothetical protein
MKEQPPKKPPIKTAMRLPADLHADLQDVAEREGHSMNTEIVTRLTAAAGGASLVAVMKQNRILIEQNNRLAAELEEVKSMVQTIVDALGPRRKR